MKDKGSYKAMKSAAFGSAYPPHLKIDQTQRSASILKNVRYVIESHFIPTGNGQFDEDKIYAIFCERARHGKYFKAPYLGCREFPAYFRLVEDGEKVNPLEITKDYGIMLYDLDYTGKEIRPYFFHAKAENGVIDVAKCEVIQ